MSGACARGTVAALAFLLFAAATAGCLGPWADHECRLMVQHLQPDALGEAERSGALVVDPEDARTKVPLLVDTFVRAERVGTAGLGEPGFHTAWDYLAGLRGGYPSVVSFDGAFFAVDAVCA